MWGALALSACESELGTATPSWDGGESTWASAGDIGTGDGAALYDPTYVATMELEVSEDSLAILRADADQPINFDDFTYVLARLTYDGSCSKQWVYA